MNENGMPSIYEGKESYIFVSYSHKDAKIVWPIVKKMNQDGFRIWYDDGIHPGTEWDKIISSKIRGARCFIAFMSDNYLNSNNCLDELKFARDVIPTRLLCYLHKVQLPDEIEMRLGRSQHIAWHTFSNKDVFFEKLYTAEAIRECQNDKCVSDESGQSVDQLSGKFQISNIWIAVVAGVVLLIVIACIMSHKTLREPKNENNDSQFVESDIKTESGKEEKVQETDPVTSVSNAFTGLHASESDAEKIVMVTGEVPVSGTCGENVSWTIDSDYVLTISGTGKMYDCVWDAFAQDTIQPWNHYQELVTKVVIEDGVENIGAVAFREFTNLISVSIPASVSEIGWTAFHRCDNLEEIMVDDKNMVLSSLEGVLYNKEKTILLIYPSNKEDDLFDVPDTVKEVDSNAFSNCLKLTKIIFPEATEEIKGLGEINKLEEIVVDERNPVYSSSNGVLYDKEKVTLYAYPCNKKSSVFNAPETLENVEYGAFEGCYNLKSIIFPDTTTNIASLSGAENLTYFVFPKEMEIIPQDFFGYTNTVETVIIQENISVIENGAFECVWINNVYYTGTEEQWGEIMILPENDGLSFADIHYDYDIKNEYY